MVTLTKNEKEALLILFKDFTSYYNANSLSKKLGITHVGTQKLLKRLKEENITISKVIGKSVVYKLNLENEYARKLVAFLLVDEANNHKRWLDEFHELFKKDRIVLIYGSVIRNYQEANDIDIMVVIKKGEVKEVKKVLIELEEILPKKIHDIRLTKKDLIENITNRQKAIIDIVKTAVVLYGQETYVEIIKNVTSF